jgi:hypothetical protein
MGRAGSHAALRASRDRLQVLYFVELLSVPTASRPEGGAAVAKRWVGCFDTTHAAFDQAVPSHSALTAIRFLTRTNAQCRRGRGVYFLGKRSGKRSRRRGYTRVRRDPQSPEMVGSNAEQAAG